jgi:hypothetical protein
MRQDYLILDFKYDEVASQIPAGYMDVRIVNEERSRRSRTGWSKTLDRAPESGPWRVRL